MKKYIVGLAAASALFSSFAMAGSSNYDDRIYGGLMVNYIDTDVEDRRVNTSEGGVRAIVGKQFTKNLGAEAYGSFNKFGLWGPFGLRLKEASVGVNGMLYPTTSCAGVFRPFLKAGVGATVYNSDSDFDPHASLGAGAFWRLNKRGVSIRTDAELRYLNSDGTLAGTGDGPFEPIFNAGITVPFGSGSELNFCDHKSGNSAVDAAMALPEQGMTEAAPAPAAKPAPTPAPATAAKDTDGDGVADATDRCPGTPAGAKVDVNGCPVPETVVIYFAFDSAELNSAAKGALDRVAANLNNKTFVVAIANGHADATGTEEYNMGLSDRRASSVASYLRSKGVSSEAIRKRAYGESRPAADNSTELGRAKNRRVEINLLRQ